MPRAPGELGQTDAVADLAGIELVVDAGPFRVNTGVDIGGKKFRRCERRKDTLVISFAGMLHDGADRTFDEVRVGACIADRADLFLVEEHRQAVGFGFIGSENRFESRIGTDPVVLPVAADKAAIEPHVP